MDKKMYGGTYTCKKTSKRHVSCNLKPLKSAKKSKGRGTKKSKRGPAMRMARKRAAKMPGGKGPVAKRPAGRKILG